MGFSYIPDNLESVGISRGAEIIWNAKVYVTAMGLSLQSHIKQKVRFFSEPDLYAVGQT